MRFATFVTGPAVVRCCFAVQGTKRAMPTQSPIQTRNAVAIGSGTLLSAALCLVMAEQCLAATPRAGCVRSALSLVWRSSSLRRPQRALKDRRQRRMRNA
jgi:hypothetical protein